MNVITLNLAGSFFFVRYSKNFRKLGIWDLQWKCWHPITQKKPLVLDCGQILTPEKLALTIKHKLGSL